MGGRRSEVCPRREHLEHIFAPFGDDLNLSGWAIANPSSKPESLRLVSGREAKSYPLNSPAHEQAKLPQGRGHSSALLKQLQQPCLVQNPDPQVLGFLELRARFCAGNQEVGLSTDRSRHS